MSKRDKLIEKIKNNPRNVSYEDLRKLLLQNNFKERDGKGSHQFFTKGDKAISIPKKHPVNKTGSSSFSLLKILTPTTF